MHTSLVSRLMNTCEALLTVSCDHATNHEPLSFLQIRSESVTLASLVAPSTMDTTRNRADDARSMRSRMQILRRQQVQFSACCTPRTPCCLTWCSEVRLWDVACLQVFQEMFAGLV